MKKNIIFSFLVALASFGCAPLTTVEGDFGNSVRANSKAQSLNATAPGTPGDAPVTGIDQEYAAAAVKAFREDVAKPKEDMKVIFELSGQK